MKTKTLALAGLAVLVIGGAVLYATGNLGDLQGRFGAASGGISLVLASDTPRADIVVAGDADVEVSKYTLSATSEEFVVTDLQVNNRGTLGDMDHNINSVTLRYEDSSGATAEQTAYLVTGVATFSGLDLYVSTASSADLTILVDLNDISSLGSSATAGEKIQLYVSATGLRAVGQTSARTITNWTGSAPTKPNLMHVYETKPTLALSSSSPSGARSVSSSDEVFIFTVTADANEKVELKNLKILLTSDADFDTTAVTSATLKEGAVTLATARVAFTDSSNAYVQFSFSGAEVAEGTTSSYTLVLDTNTLLDEDTGADDPLAVSINLGSAGSPGGLKWNDTNVDVTWVGNVSSTRLSGYTLTY
jgi:hypothetical protein